MRVLVADRNRWVLESIARTFARDFDISTATTLTESWTLLREAPFDIAIVGEKLADAPGVTLLGLIARYSSDTLRVFAARPARLELLQARLGVFGLFRTLPLPIDPRKLQSILKLAREGLEGDFRSAMTPPVRAQAPVVSRKAAPQPPARKPNPPPSARPVTPTRRPNSPPPVPPSARPATPARKPNSPPLASSTTPPQRPAPPVPRSGQPARKPTTASPTSPMRSKFTIAAASVAVFVVTTLVLNPSGVPSAHESASLTAPDQTLPSRAAVLPTPMISPPETPVQAQVIEPKQPAYEPESQQIAASTTPPVADPSAFGSEAYESTYTN